MTRVEAFALVATVAIILLVAAQIRQIDPLSGEKILFHGHGWDEFKICRMVNSVETCRTVGEIFP